MTGMTNLATRPASGNSPAPAIERLLLPGLALLAAAALFYFGTGLTPIPGLAVLAPLPILLLAPWVSPWTTLTVAFGGYLLGTANSWDFYLHSHDFPLPLGPIVAVGGAVLFALVAAQFRALMVRGRPLLAAVSTPAGWAGAMFGVSVLSPKGVLGTLAWGQTDVPTVLQIASVTGIWGVEYLVLLVPATVAAAVTAGVIAQVRVRAAVLVGAVLALLLAWSSWRLTTAPETPQQRIAMIAQHDQHWAADPQTPQGRVVLDGYLGQIAALPTGVDYAVLPEGVLSADDADLHQLVAELSTAAVDAHTTLVVGVVLTTAGKTYNTAVQVPADGSSPRIYRKWHDGGARITVGHDLVLLPGTGGPTGLMVCLDANLRHPSDDYADAGVRTMLIPAADEDVNGAQHARTALIRGVENGFSVAWAGQRGVLLAADGYGRIRSEAATSDRSGFTVTVTELAAGPGRTFYARFGDWFGWLCLALALAGIGGGLTRLATSSRSVRGR